MFKLFALVFAALVAVACAKPGYVAPAVAYAAPVAHYGYAAPYYTGGYAAPYAYSGYGYGNGLYGYARYGSPYHFY